MYVCKFKRFLEYKMADELTSTSGRVMREVTIKFLDYSSSKKAQKMHMGSISDESVKKTSGPGDFFSKCGEDCMFRAILTTQSKMFATDNLHCELYFPANNLACTVNIKNDGMIFYYPRQNSPSDRFYDFATITIPDDDYWRMIHRLESLQQTKFDGCGFFCYPLLFMKSIMCCEKEDDFEDYTTEKITCARMVFLALAEISGIDLLDCNPSTVTPDDIKRIINTNFIINWNDMRVDGYTKAVGRFA